MKRVLLGITRVALLAGAAAFLASAPTVRAADVKARVR
jgi:hypothetical protein